MGVDNSAKGIKASDLFSLGRNGKIDRDGLDYSLRLIGYIPSGRDWGNFLSRFLLFLGIALLASGVVFFFAYNWNSIPKFLKFALAELAVVLAAVIAMKKGLDTIAGKGMLLLASVFTGVFLAVFGQTYQTGADPYELFRGWLILILFWTVISRFAPQWMLLLILVNISFSLYWVQIVDPLYSDSSLVNFLLILLMINLIALAAIEAGNLLRIEWLKGRWMSRSIALAVSSVSSAIMIFCIFDYNKDTSVFAWIFFPSYVAVVFYFYRNILYDLFILTISLMSIMVVLTSFLIYHLGDYLFDDFGGFLVLALLIIAQGAGAGMYLRSLHLQKEIKNEN